MRHGIGVSSGRVSGVALAFMFLAAVALGGCVTSPTAAGLRSAPAPHRAIGDAAGLSDGRARFRRLFCARLPGDTDCATWLWRLDDEPSAVPSAGSTPRPLHVVLVPGAFAQCFGAMGLPFREEVAGLRAAGHRVDTIDVEGRSGTARNASLIASWFAGQQLADEMPVVLVGYSKGAADMLAFLDAYPEQAARVKAAVGVAGAVHGSPLAGGAADWGYKLFSWLPSRQCPVGDGQIIHSLRAEEREQWLAQARLPAGIRYYSLAAMASRARVARALVPSWKQLLRTDPRNDGQLLARDQILPGSTVLGYVNADHWAMALDLEPHHPHLLAREDPGSMPRGALLQALVQQIAEDLPQ